MKKTIITIFILIIALAAIAGALVLADKLFYVPNEEPTLNNYSYKADEVAGIDISASVAYINIMRSSDSDVAVDCIDAGRGLYSVTCDGGQLTVTGKKLPWYDTLRHIDSGKYGVTVVVPDSFSGEINITLDAGEIKIDGAGATNINIVGNAGDITVSNVSAENLHITADVSDIKLGAVSAELIDVFVSVGNITFSDADIGASVSFNTETGNIEGNFTDKRADFTVFCGADVGTVNVTEDDNAVGGDNVDKTIKCDLRTSIGDITVEFGE